MVSHLDKGINAIKLIFNHFILIDPFSNLKLMC
jgi:hypothetical protein